MSSKNSFAFNFSSSTMQNFSLLPLHSQKKKKTSTKNSKSAKLWTREHSGESDDWKNKENVSINPDSPLCSLVQSLADLLFLALVFFQNVKAEGRNFAL